jgi:tetraacyldisaccharide 4'-kinase
MLARWLQQQWFQRRLTPALWLLLPLLLPVNLLFIAISGWRRRTVQPVRLPVPVVVVGNITVGGAGKTPLTLWLAQQLRERGWQPGIVSRGYGGAGQGARAVLADSSPQDVGDEPLLLARRSAVPVWVGRDRAAAGAALLAAHPGVDICCATMVCNMPGWPVMLNSPYSTGAAWATAGDCRWGRCASRRRGLLRSTR